MKCCVNATHLGATIAGLTGIDRIVLRKRWYKLKWTGTVSVTLTMAILSVSTGGEYFVIPHRDIEMREEEAKKTSFRSQWMSGVSKKPAGWRAQCLEFLHKEGRLTLLLVMLGISGTFRHRLIS